MAITATSMTFDHAAGITQIGFINEAGVFVETFVWTRATARATAPVRTELVRTLPEFLSSIQLFRDWLRICSRDYDLTAGSLIDYALEYKQAVGKVSAELHIGASRAVSDEYIRANNFVTSGVRPALNLSGPGLCFFAETQERFGELCSAGV